MTLRLTALLIWNGILALSVQAQVQRDNPGFAPSRVTGDTLASRQLQNRFIDPPSVADASHRLLMDQIDALIRAGDAGEAIEKIETLSIRASRKIIAQGAVQQAGTLALKRYVPIRDWIRGRLASLWRHSAEAQREYLARYDSQSQTVFDRLQANQDLTLAESQADKLRWTARGADMQHLLADLYLERGWSIACLQILDRAFPQSLRADVSAQESQGSLPWGLVWRHMASGSESQRKQFIETFVETVSGSADAGPLSADSVFAGTLRRANMAADMAPELLDRESLAEWETQLAPFLSKELQAEIASWALDAPRPRSAGLTKDWKMLGGNARRCQSSGEIASLEPWPDWGQVVPLVLATQDVLPADRPRVGERAQATLCYHPVIHDGRVYTNSLTEIHSVDLTSGRSWPASVPSRPLYSSGIAQSALIPLGYPLQGMPRGVIAIHGNELYARMGEAVTAWASNKPVMGDRSQSYLVALDLERQGSMVDGFPLFLEPPAFDGSEFEGAPTAFGDVILAPVVERDNVGLRRSVAAFQRDGGQLVWRSPVLATGMVVGAQDANLISNQLLTVAGGRIFYNTNLGSIVCLNPLDGGVEWLAQYQPTEEPEQSHRGDRFRYRDLNPCLVDRGLVICAPQDCAEVFALDASTGDLVWSTDADLVPDANHLLGVTNDHLVLGGDRLYWLDRLSGQLAAVYPGSHTPGPDMALPSPRGLGRGALSHSSVYWPISGEILVFQAQLEPPESGRKMSVAEPVLLRRIKLASRSQDGGNLVVVDGCLVYASAMRIMAFR